jgi:hypothetical protein
MDNPTFYISIISTVGVLISELLPFLPVQANGVIHAICGFLNIVKQEPNSLESDLDYTRVENKYNPLYENHLQNHLQNHHEHKDGNNKSDNNDNILILKTISVKIDTVLDKLEIIKLTM